MTTETTLTSMVCNYKALPGGSTLGEIIATAGLHAEELVAEVLKAGISLARASLVTEDMRAAAQDAVAETLGDAYDCGRVWSAWQHGTMSADDFHPIVADPDRLAEIAGAAIDAMGVHILPVELAVTDPMSLGEAAMVLAKHNTWRCSGNGPALDSKVIGTAIDTAVAHLLGQRSGVVVRPPAPGSVLEQFREVVEYRYSAELAAFERGTRNESQFQKAEADRSRLLAVIDAAERAPAPPSSAGVESDPDGPLTTAEIEECEAERGNGMTSAVGEYTPREFWRLLDEVKARRAGAEVQP